MSTFWRDQLGKITLVLFDSGSLNLLKSLNVVNNHRLSVDHFFFYEIPRIKIKRSKYLDPRMWVTDITKIFLTNWRDTDKGYHYLPRLLSWMDCPNNITKFTLLGTLWECSHRLVTLTKFLQSIIRSSKMSPTKTEEVFSSRNFSTIISLSSV